ncbi:MAG: NifU family protein [Candidatus Omnitrophota bacterium]
MDFIITVQPTPNPNALKFVLNVPIKMTDSAVFKTAEDAAGVPLAASILALANVSEVYFSGKFLTVTQNGAADWNVLETDVKRVIEANIAAHKPDFDLAAKKSSASTPLSGELARVNDILDSTIRPALQRDGGDLEVVAVEGDVVTISYQGACGCCPHAAMGTLYAIQNILQDQYKPGVQVQLA